MGIITGLTIILLWALHLAYLLCIAPVDGSLWTVFHAVVQMHLFTGLFITGHDAIHGTVSHSTFVNKCFGRLCALLFAGISYRKLSRNHELHHRFPGTEQDPDFNSKSQNFLTWWLTFLFRYAGFGQIIFMALIFNVLKQFAGELHVWLYWVLPVFLSSLQLFYFGTFRPHRLPLTESMGKHRARSWEFGDVSAFLSCYFFGYHREHHESPGTPWWQMPKLKKTMDNEN